MESTKKVVFDAHAILKWTQKESGYTKIKSILIACRNKSALGFMSEINLGEVYYVTIRGVGLDGAKAFLENFLRLPINLVLPDRNLILKAAELKAEYSISYADCLAAATALTYEAALLTGEPRNSRNYQAFCQLNGSKDKKQEAHLKPPALK
jgi:predicted nucleic acid-binding protein